MMERINCASVATTAINASLSDLVHLFFFLPNHNHLLRTFVPLMITIYHILIILSILFFYFFFAFLNRIFNPCYNPCLLYPMVAVHAAIGSSGLPVGAIVPFFGPAPNLEWLECDGTDTTGTSRELQTHYPTLYSYLGNTNVLPDLRECSLVGVGKNETYVFDSTELDPATGTQGTQDHDVYTVGEFKDDQLGLQNATWRDRYNGSEPSYGFYWQNSTKWQVTTAQVLKNARVGTTTHGKRIGVTYCIKAV